MLRLIAFTAAALVLAHAADAKPARPLYEPEKSVNRTVVRLQDTVWERIEKTGKTYITFKADGTLRYQSSKSKETLSTGSPGKWRIVGDELFFDVNNYSEHHGIVQGNLISIQATNKANTRFSYELRRVQPPK